MSGPQLVGSSKGSMDWVKHVPPSPHYHLWHIICTSFLHHWHILGPLVSHWYIVLHHCHTGKKHWDIVGALALFIIGTLFAHWHIICTSLIHCCYIIGSLARHCSCCIIIGTSLAHHLYIVGTILVCCIIIGTSLAHHLYIVGTSLADY